jgi:hypothetical protein
MHCTAFTSFPKPLALNVACDTAIFHPLRGLRWPDDATSVDSLRNTVTVKPDTDQVMKKNNNIILSTVTLYGSHEGNIG